MTKGQTKTSTRKAGPRGLELLGDPAMGRPRLGPTAPVDMFRALRLIGVMEGLDDTLGKDSSALVHNSGKYLGYGLGQAILDATGRDLGKYVDALANKLRELGVGILSVPELRLEDDFLKVRVDECITCAGMPPIGKVICHFEAGFVAGVLEVFLGGGRKCRVREVKCWAQGDKTCEFDVQIR
ncbi:MAG: 4-vinyl reductase [Elusimicrobia bacterium]|nr:4-vinyl reductase [Elusimicrobiota bacterium]